MQKVHAEFKNRWKTGALRGIFCPVEYSPTAATWGVRFGMCQGGKISLVFPPSLEVEKGGAGLLPPLKAPAAAEAGPYLLWHVEFNYG